MASSLLHPDEALARIIAECQPLSMESLALQQSVGRVLAQTIASPVALPPFSNSAMDGYALVTKAEILPAGSELPVTGELAAGDAPTRADNGAVEIMTGAPLPSGADRVVPVESVEKLASPPRIRLHTPVEQGQNVRAAGTDVEHKESLITAGTRLEPQHIMLLAAVGQYRVNVTARPRVAVLCTGKELVDVTMPTLEPGRIYNSNGPFLAARLPCAGAEWVHQETVSDDVDAFLAAFARAKQAGCHVVISSGAVSMGRYDFVPQALERLGAEIVFHKIAIRPGKPLLFAKLPDGTLYFGLPGNPIATAVGLRFFVEPALRAMMALPPEKPWRLPLAAPYKQARPLRFHLKSKVVVNASGQLAAKILPGQQSYRIKPLADANAWAVTTVETEALAGGDLVDVYGLGHLQSPYVPG